MLLFPEGSAKTLPVAQYNYKHTDRQMKTVVGTCVIERRWLIGVVFRGNSDIFKVRRESALAPRWRVHLPVGAVATQRRVRLKGLLWLPSLPWWRCHWREALLGRSCQVIDVVTVAGMNQEFRGGLGFLAQLAAKQRLCMALFSGLNWHEALLEQSLCENHLALGAVDIAVPANMLIQYWRPLLAEKLFETLNV